MEAYLAGALRRIKQLKSEESFTLQELFQNYEWTNLDIEKRTTLEKMFLHAIEIGKAQGIIILDKNQEGEQVYRKE